jgi:alkylated DNA nucleotide flippase Atl1
VNREGGLAIGFPGGREVQRQLLEQEGIACDDSYHVVQFSELRWRPDSH